MGSGPRSAGGTYRKEFWWEREWRKKGDFLLPDTYIIIAPETRHGEFDVYNQAVIDPNWGLEAIIARLAGFAAADVGPF